MQRIAIKSRFEAYIYLPGRTIRLWNSHGLVYDMVSSLLIPLDSQHNFRTLEAYNKALIEAREATVV